MVKWLFYITSQLCSVCFKLWLHGILIWSYIMHLLANTSTAHYYLEVTIAIWQLHNRLLSGSNARHFSTIVCQRSPEDKRSTEEFWLKDHKLYLHYTGTFAWNCSLLTNHAHRLHTKFDKCRYLGQGNLNLVSEKSGKYQGILLFVICGNPVKPACSATETS